MNICKYTKEDSGLVYLGRSLFRAVGGCAVQTRAAGRPYGRPWFFTQGAEAVLQNLTLDVLKTSEIKDQVLNVDQVRSSLTRKLGMDIGALTPADRDGVVEILWMLRSKYSPSYSILRRIN